MANNLKINPIGLDAIIHKAQKMLYDKLVLLWTGVVLDGYPRCYVINRNGVKTIEHYFLNKEYRSLIHAEGNKFFFTSENDIDGDTDIRAVRLSTDIDLYFIVNVPEIKPSLIHRGDEEIRNDVMDVISKIPGVYFKRLVKNIDKVFTGFQYINENDMQPYHCFKITLEVRNYLINEQVC